LQAAQKLLERQGAVTDGENFKPFVLAKHNTTQVKLDWRREILLIRKIAERKSNFANERFFMIKPA
jgi:hypothetical protein